jgi:hypothetical protein
MAGLDHRDTVTDFEMPAGTFFDIGVVHLLTTPTLDPLRALNVGVYASIVSAAIRRGDAVSLA